MRRFTRSGYMTACSFTVMILAIDAASRLIAPTLPVDPGKWPRVEIASKVAQMRDYANEGKTAEVVFVGSSMTAGGIDPVEFTKASRRSSYNAAFAGPSPRTVVPWVLDVVEPLLHPKVVVIGLQTRDLNDNSAKNAKMYRNFSNSPGYKQSKGSIAGRLESGLEEFSHFLRYRRVLRQPTELFAANEAEERALAEADLRKVIGARGIRVEEPTIYRRPQALMDNLATRSLERFSVGGVEYEALVRLARELHAKDIQLVILNLPVTDDYYDAHADAAEDRVRYRELLEEFSRRHRITIVDAENAFESSAAFRDPIHLDVEGRIALARVLGERWERVADGRGTSFDVGCVGELEPRCRLDPATLASR